MHLRSPARLLLVVLTLVGSAALAQINPLIPLNITYNSLNTYTFGANACNGALTATWTSTLRGTPCSDLRIWLTNGSCGDAPTGADNELTSVTSIQVFSLRTGQIPVSFTDLPFPSGVDGGAACGAGNVTVNFKLCAAISLQSGVSCIVSHATPLAIDYDTQPPSTPAIETLTVKDAALSAKVSFSSDSYFVYLQAKGGADTDFGHDKQIIVADTSTGTIDGLANGTTYDVRAYAVDQAGNQSGYSDIVSGTPLHSSGFWEAYRRAGGQDQGCAAVSAPPLLLAALVWLARRRKR
jgi:hypothetical protein